MKEVSQMEWRVCIDFPDYEVSECGDVRRATDSKTRKAGWRPRGFIDQDGYLKYALLDGSGGKRSIYAHRLVAVAFIGPAPSENHEVAHNNGSRVSNHFSNLRWATRLENAGDMEIHETRMGGAKNPNAKLSEEDVRAIRSAYRAIKDGETEGKVSDLARSYGIHHATLVHIAKGRSWACLS
jgi:hypothetical protein